MKFLFRILVAIAVAASAFAQEKTPKPEKSKPAGTENPPPAEVGETPRPPTPVTASNDLPAQIAGIFFGLLQKGQIDPAYEGLTRASKIADRPEEISTLKQKTREAIDVFGPIQNYELVETKNVGTHLLRRTYLSLNKEFPLRWRFYFYLSENLWRLIDLRVDDRVTGMFDESEEAKAATEAK